MQAHSSVFSNKDFREESTSEMELQNKKNAIHDVYK